MNKEDNTLNEEVNLPEPDMALLYKLMYMQNEDDDEGSDFTSYNDHKSEMRYNRAERFEKNNLPKLLKKVGEENVKYEYCVYTITLEDNIIKFYPMANSLYNKKLKKWIKPGVGWLRANKLI